MRSIAWSRWCHTGAGAILFVIALFSLVALFYETGRWILVWIALFLVEMWLAVRVMYAARRLVAPPGEIVLETDPRPPVLYLRCFTDDEISGQFGPWYRMNHFTEEEQLASVLRGLGPFVAVGRPGEERANVGASRLYFPDSEWRIRVAALMARARLVVIRTGDSDGLWWETKEVLRSLQHDKLLLVVDDEDELASFCRQLGAQQGQEITPPSLKQGRIGSITGLVVFRPDWTPRLLKPVRSFLRQSLRRPYEARLRLTLRPLFDRMGARWTAPPLSLSKLAFLTFVTGLALARLPGGLRAVLATDKAAPKTVAPQPAPSPMVIAPERVPPALDLDQLGVRLKDQPKYADLMAPSLPEWKRLSRLNQMVREGRRRVPDEAAVIRLRLLEKLAASQDQRICALMVRGDSGPQTREALAQLEREDAQAFLHWLAVAARAGLDRDWDRGLSAQKIEAIWRSIRRRVPPEDRPHFDDVLLHLPDASDTETCWFARQLVGVLPRLSGQEQKAVGRL